MSGFWCYEESGLVSGSSFKINHVLERVAVSEHSPHLQLSAGDNHPIQYTHRQACKCIYKHRLAEKNIFFCGNQTITVSCLSSST